MHELTRARAKVKSAVLASLGVHSRSWLGWVATAGGLFLLAVVLGCDDNPSSELNLPVLQVGPEQAVAPRFDNVVSIDRLANGTLVVADEGTASITYVGP